MGNREANFGGILGETLALIGDCARWVIIFIAVVGGLTAAGSVLGLVSDEATLQFGFRIDQTDTLASAVFKLGSAAVTVIASYLLLQKFLESRGRLSAGGTRIWAYIGMTIVAAIATVLGFILLIVPGIILLVRWSASSGYLIGERASITDSLKASWDSTSGQSWPIFLAGLVMFIGYVVFAAALGGVAALVDSDDAIAIITGIVDAGGSVISMAFAIAVYLLVSDTSDEVGQVFA